MHFKTLVAGAYTHVANAYDDAFQRLRAARQLLIPGVINAEWPGCIDANAFAGDNLRKRTLPRRQGMARSPNDLYRKRALLRDRDRVGALQQRVQHEFDGSGSLARWTSRLCRQLQRLWVGIELGGVLSASRQRLRPEWL
jgi:hypothetical protein